MTSLLSKRTGLILALAFVLSATLFSVLSNGQTQEQQATSQSILWSDQHIEVTLSAGESVSKSIEFVTKSKLKKITVEPSLEIEPFLTVEPKKVKKITANQQQIVNLNFSAAPEISTGRYEGTIHVRLRDGTLLDDVLFVSINVGLLQYENKELGIKVKYPAETDVLSDEGSVRFFNIRYPTSPPEFALRVFNPSVDQSKPFQAILLDIAMNQLGNDFLNIVQFTGKGVVVEAGSFSRLHYFTYSPTKNRAVELVGGSPDFFASNTFTLVIDSLEF